MMVKKLNKKPIRQGQTVYVVYYDLGKRRGDARYRVLAALLNNDAPPPCYADPFYKGVVSRFLAAELIAKTKRGEDGVNVTRSRRKAERKAQELNHYAGVSV